MGRRPRIWWMVQAAPLGVLAMVGCSVAVRDRLAHFFFEIPEDRSAASASGGNSAASAAADGHTGTAAAGGRADGVEAMNGEAVPAAAKGRFLSVHAPVAERDCTACHVAADRMHIPEDYVRNTCRGCHEAYFARDITHPPVRRGRCHECHVPHRSEQPYLLHFPVFQTCLECHEEPARLSPEWHSRPGVEHCTACHDPHFGDGFRLKHEWPKDVWKALNRDGLHEASPRRGAEALP